MKVKIEFTVDIDRKGIEAYMAFHYCGDESIKEFLTSRFASDAVFNIDRSIQNQIGYDCNTTRWWTPAPAAKRPRYIFDNELSALSKRAQRACLDLSALSVQQLATQTTLDILRCPTGSKAVAAEIEAFLRERR
jgi:hypothetical protein